MSRRKRSKRSKRSPRDPRVVEIMDAVRHAAASRSSSAAQTASYILCDGDYMFRPHRVDEWASLEQISAIVLAYALACPSDELGDLVERARGEVQHVKQWDQEFAARDALTALGLDDGAAERVVDGLVKEIAARAAEPHQETVQ